MDKCVNVSQLLSSATQTGNLTSNNSNSASTPSMASNHMPLNEISSTTSDTSNKDETSVYSSLVQESDSSHSLVQMSSLHLKSLNRLNTPIEICNAAHFANLKDIQTYILNRLDNDALLKSKFVKQNNSIDMLNLLLIKANFCLLYVEKVLDLILSGVIKQAEITDIPGTLHGLYLYLLQHALKCVKTETNNVKQNTPAREELLYAILGLTLISAKPFDKRGIYKRLQARFTSLEFVYYETLFDYITPLLFAKLRNISKKTDENEKEECKEQTKFIIFHPSFKDWLTDVKFCTQKYLCSLDEAHFCLTFYYFRKLVMLKRESENLNNSAAKASCWNKFKFHLAQAANVLSEAEFSYYYLLCESEYELKIALSTLDRKLLQCKKLLKIDQDLHVLPIVNEKEVAKAKEDLVNQTKMDYEAIFSMFDMNQPKFDHEHGDKTQINNMLFDLVARGDLVSTRQLLKNDFKLKQLMNKVFDSYNQTTLLVAVKLNNYEFVEFLIRLKSVKLDHCDNSGWTALRYSAWIG